jgi:hypothetical protein
VDRLSHLLRQAGEPGTSDKHRLIRLVAGRLAVVEGMLWLSIQLLERGQTDVAKFYLKKSMKILGVDEP